MKIVLWDTRRRDASKDFAGGYGVGQYSGEGGIRGQMVRWFYKRDHRPAALTFAYLASVFRKLGHTVEFGEDRVVPGGDVYVFSPSLITLDLELEAMREIFKAEPSAKILVVGILATTLPAMFADLPVVLVQGEPEQLLWKLDDVLNHASGPISVGSVQDLDALPFPDWDLFEPQKFRIGYDFSAFPTGLIQQSRGCTFTCNYCPYIVIENKTRFRSPESVVDEMRRGIKNYGFRSFKFRDPLFGLDRKRVVKLADLISHLPRKIQFSIESRIDLLRPETLAVLKAVGLTSITVGIETPDETTLKQYKRAPINDDKQRQFVDNCRRLGIRTVAGFMIGFPEDTAQSIKGVLRYAKSVNPTFANFNIVTPYPGTEFYNQVVGDIAEFDVTKYNVYTPVMKYKHLTSAEVSALHARCFVKFYHRWDWVRDNAHLLWPASTLLGFGYRPPVVPATAAAPAPATIALPVITAADGCDERRVA